MFFLLPLFLHILLLTNKFYKRYFNFFSIYKQDLASLFAGNKITVQTSTNHLLIGAKRTRNASQRDTHLAKGDFSYGCRP